MGYPTEADFEEAARGPSGPDYHYTFGVLQSRAHRIAKSKGFWDKDAGDICAIALMHSELSEALEAIRHGNQPSEHIPNFSGVEEELADVVIRILDTCEKRGYRLIDAILAKMDYNSTRPHMHGGKAV